MTGGQDAAVTAAIRFIEVLAELDRDASRQRRTLPTSRERRRVNAAFWDELIPALTVVEVGLDDAERSKARREVQMVLNPWLLRSRLWARSWLKPHGYPGDYLTLEWIYDLERDDCADPYQPAIVNLLDGLFGSVHSVHAFWRRRAWFRSLIAGYVRAASAPVRVLDVGSGSGRSVRDAIERYGRHAVIGTFFDEDPAALSFLRSQLPAGARGAASLICAPLSRIEELVPSPADPERAPFDVAVSAGSFDYLEGERARELLAHMISLTRPGGTVALSTFSVEDPSRLVNDWVMDWRLIYRTRADLADLFAPGPYPVLTQSPGGGPLYARVTIGAAAGRRRSRSMRPGTKKG